MNWLELTFTSIILVYLSVASLLRWRRYNQVHAKYGLKVNTLTPEEAQDVILLSSMWDMPGLYTYSVTFALFKTYGIPSISKLLAQTKELGSAERVSKRYADTEILITTWIQCPLGGIRITPSGKTEHDPRGAIALARTNWLHSKHEISNDDFLYTMSLFIFEPIDWCAKYGWRPLSPLECQAHYVFWVKIGNTMGIKDIPNSLDGLRKWSDTYEKAHMVPATTNRDIADLTTDELLHTLPERFGLKDFGRRLIICMLDERVRVAMMRPAQGWVLHALAEGVMHGTKYLHRYLSLPRMSPLSLLDLTPNTSSGLPRMNPTRWTAKPWYKPKSSPFFDRLMVRLGLCDDVPGPEYNSDGYRLEEMGPIPFTRAVHEEVFQKAEEILGCPITGPWALNGGR